MSRADFPDDFLAEYEALCRKYGVMVENGWPPELMVVGVYTLAAHLDAIRASEAKPERD